MYRELIKQMDEIDLNTVNSKLKIVNYPKEHVLGRLDDNLLRYYYIMVDLHEKCRVIKNDQECELTIRNRIEILKEMFINEIIEAFPEVVNFWSVSVREDCGAIVLVAYVKSKSPSKLLQICFFEKN